MNRSLTSDRAHQDMWYPLSKANYAVLQIMLAATTLGVDRYPSLEPLCFPNASPELEKRKSKWVQFYINALNAGMDVDTLPDVEECEIVGIDDIAVSGTYASLTTAMAGANNDIVFTSRTIGTIGNSRSIRLVDPAGNDQALVISVVGGNMVSASLATGPGGAITTTAAQLRAAILAHAAANALVSTANAGADTGVGIVIALAETFLAGGTD